MPDTGRKKGVSQKKEKKALAISCLAMLPKQNRLKKKKDFERVFKQGKGIKRDFLLFKFVKNDLGASRFGFVVSQKISKKVTVRNKIKRRLRAVLREELPKIKPGFDGVWVVLKNSTPPSFKEIQETIKKIFQKAPLIKK